MPSKTTNKESRTTFQTITAKSLDSRLVKMLANFRPVAWLTRQIVRNIVRRKVTGSQITPIDNMRSGSLDLQENLQSIVIDVVEVYGYAGAMLATYERGDYLPIQAFYADPDLINIEKIYALEREVSQYTPFPVSLTNPDIARVNRFDPAHQENLSVKAVKAEKPVITHDLFDLFTPIAPPASKQIIEGFQSAFNIEQAVAVPFFLVSKDREETAKEIVGNLFAIKQTEITEQDILNLSALGRQAAAAIETERRRLQSKIAQNLVYIVQTHIQDETQMLQHIAQGVVNDLGYIGAMVGTYEEDDSIPVRAFHINPGIASLDQIKSMEDQVSKYTPHPISITNPDIARVNRYDPKHADNLSVKAVNSGEPVISEDLFDLLRPIAPNASQQTIKGIQEELGIQQVIAVPFFLETITSSGSYREVVGNLFAATQSKSFSLGEIELLRTFAQQAAVGLRNARLFRKAENRRIIAETFGRMAFRATTNIHELRSQTEEVKNFLAVLQRLVGQHKIEEKNLPLIRDMLARNPEMIERLSTIESLLDHLHEPWQDIPSESTNVSTCLETAVQNSRPRDDSYFIDFHLNFSADLPPIHASPEMLTEAFGVFIDNAIAAIDRKGKVSDRHIWITSSSPSKGCIEISIKDNGSGIQSENLTKIFEFDWTAKKLGPEFGLYWSKDFIEGIGGKISVDSTWGAGTTFTIQFQC